MSFRVPEQDPPLLHGFPSWTYDPPAMGNPQSGSVPRVSPHVVCASLLGVILLLAVSLRFAGLGDRSLWSDEFCTWKVSQLPLAESLHWQPELTKPPLYQFAVRCLTSPLRNHFPRFETTEPGPSKVYQVAPYGVPSEWHLRLPAAICGTLAVAAMWWLGSIAGGWMLGAASALLFAVQELQIDYSQEARPYSMLVLGSVVSTGIWHRLIERQQGNEATCQRGEFHANVWAWAIAYVLITALSFHANYLIVLTVAVHLIWTIMNAYRESQFSNLKSQIRGIVAPAIAMMAIAILCTPMVWHFLRHRTSVFQGLDWIAPTTVHGAFTVLGEITFGPLWVWGLVAPAMTVSLAVAAKGAVPEGAADERRWTRIFLAERGNNEFHWLAVVWLLATWGGLLVISSVAHPAMVARYALPAAAPALLLPLLVLNRVDRRLPLLVAAAFAIGTAPVWATRPAHVVSGFREMVEFLDEYADPTREAVVVVVERTASPGWEEVDLLGFEYYGGGEAARQHGNKARHEEKARYEIEVLYLRNGKPDGDQPILRDPRALWLVVFLADPIEAIRSAGRNVEQIAIENQVFDQLYFKPYRLIRVAPVN